MNDSKFSYYKIYKPFGMLSQFGNLEGKPVLGDLYKFPKDVYSIGRLDTDSEGLLLLTNDKKLNHILLNPSFKHNRSYLVQVDGAINENAITQLESRLEITIDGKPYLTLPAKVEILQDPPILPERNPPIRFRKNIPTSWIRLTLTEGKNRQVRRMTAKVGFPTLRLVRESIEGIILETMQPGEVLELSKDWVYDKLKINIKKF